MKIPFITDFDFRYGELEQVTPLIGRVVCHNPSPLTFYGTNTYLIGKSELMLIDPGPDLNVHLEAILKAIVNRKLTHILVTHSHWDHFKLVNKLQEKTGAKIYGARNDFISDLDHMSEALLEFNPDVGLYDGIELSNQDVSIKTIATPGHASNHLCYELLGENILFSGDHIMGWSSTVVTPPDGNMSDFIESLKKIKNKNYKCLFPAHGAEIINPNNLIDAFIEHRHNREKEVINCLKWRPSQISNITRVIYKHLDEKLLRAAEQNVHAHILWLIDKGIVECDGLASLGAEYRLSNKIEINA